MADKIVPLSRRYETPLGVFDKVTMRPPTYQDIYIDALGMPREWVVGDGGKPFLVTNYAVIDQYAQRLIRDDKPGYPAIAGLDAQDARKVAEAICDFFIAPAVLTSPQTSSSSASESSPTPSPA